MRLSLVPSLLASLVILAFVSVIGMDSDINRIAHSTPVATAPVATAPVADTRVLLRSAGLELVNQESTRTATLTATQVSTAAPTQSPTRTSTFTDTATATPARATTTATRTVPQAYGSSVYWGAYISGVPWNMSLQDAFEARTRKRASIIHWGEPWIHDGKPQPFYAGDFDAVRARGAIPLLDWGSWDYALGSNQPDYQLARIYGGAFDDFIRGWATGARNWGHPLLLRFNWEMNGWWQFPWSEQLNGNRPGDYVKAWRHVHDIFASVGATNVAWVWAPNIVGARTTPLASLYPGDAYVDWVGMDGYNWGTNKGGSWQTFAQVFGSTYDELALLAPNKPIMVAETACSERDGSKARWIADALQVQLPNAFPRIRALVWFNWNDNDPNLDWPIESSQSSIDAFAAGIASPYYTANSYANLDTPPPY